MKTETPQQALERIQEGASNNDKAVMAAFSARGIALADIEPRVNVLTFRAWKAKGRSVCKGEHGARLAVYIKTKDKLDAKTGKTELGRTLPRTVSVFHISQTKLIGA